MKKINNIIPDFIEPDYIPPIEPLDLDSLDIDDETKIELIICELEKIQSYEILEFTNSGASYDEITKLSKKHKKIREDIRNTKILQELKDLKKEYKKVITEEDLIKLKIALEKETIDEAEFTLIHGYSKGWQDKKRKLMKYPLPVVGTSKIDGSNVGKKHVRSKKIFYYREQAAQWVKDYA